MDSSLPSFWRRLMLGISLACWFAILSAGYGLVMMIGGFLMMMSNPNPFVPFLAFTPVFLVFGVAGGFLYGFRLGHQIPKDSWLYPQMGLPSMGFLILSCAALAYWSWGALHAPYPMGNASSTTPAVMQTFPVRDEIVYLWVPKAQAPSLKSGQAIDVYATWGPKRDRKTILVANHVRVFEIVERSGDSIMCLKIYQKDIPSDKMDYLADNGPARVISISLAKAPGA